MDEFQWIDNDYGWAGDVMVKSAWHPINPADPTTLPGDNLMRMERGYIWYRFRNGAVRALTISRVLSMEKRLGDHWAPRFKQVPPVWEDAQQMTKDNHQIRDDDDDDDGDDIYPPCTCKASCP